MATTGFWPVKSRLKEVIDYANNLTKQPIRYLMRIFMRRSVMPKTIKRLTKRCTYLLLTVRSKEPIKV